VGVSHRLKRELDHLRLQIFHLKTTPVTFPPGLE
jgi:hypothetical protein